MFTRSPLKFLRLSLLVLFAQLAFVILAQGQVTLRGRVLYSTGEPASGATVSLSGSATQSTAADNAGNYSFGVAGGCGVEYDVQATSAEIVDDEPLPPSNRASASGCILSDVGFGDLIISKPHPITLGGHVRDQFGLPVQGITVTMTRTKYDLIPNVVTTATTITDGSGHYQFNTYSRCSVVEDFKASIGSYIFQGGTSTSGCVLSSNDNLDMIVTFSKLLNAGETSCNTSIGRPVNVTNGNVHLQQTDYLLPGAGEAIAITRTYNSISQNIGLFGRGWNTVYDETVTTDANNQLQLTMPDGRLVTALTPDFYGQIVKNGDGSYTVTFKDGWVHQFNVSGNLVSLTDPNGNQTLLTYTNGKLSSITDPFARVLTVTTNPSQRVSSISDALGTIATYTYGGSQELLTATYADNSGYQFSYLGVPAGLALASVTDALGNVIEQHDYDAQGRASSSQTHGGVERYTLNYVSLAETDVTDALGHVTKYFYSNIKGRNVVTSVQGLCSCGGSQVQTWNYDNQLNVISKTDALNHSTSYTYDGNGNRLSETDATGTVTYTYNGFAEVLTRSDQLNGVTTNTYDAQGNLLTTTDALNNATAFTYDPRGELLTMTNMLGKATTLTWDTSGRTSQTTRAVNGTKRQRGTQQEARRIWEQAIAAKGGRSRLDAVENLVISTTGSYTKSSGKRNPLRTEAFFVFPNKAWSWVDLRPDVFGLTVEMFNFESNTHYLINSDNPPPVRQAIPRTETSASQTHGLLAYLLETKWVKPELVSASTAQIGRRTVDVVHTVLRDDVEGFAPENKCIDFAFDRETHLPIRVSYYHKRGDTKVLDVAENLSDYTEVSGIKVPRKSEVDGRVDKVGIQINVAYNEDVFSKPPSIAAGPEAWRPKINR